VLSRLGGGRIPRIGNAADIRYINPERKKFC
jgi:hypothetical protein